MKRTAKTAELDTKVDTASPTEGPLVMKKLHPRDSADSRRLKESIVAKTAQRTSPVKAEVQKIEALRQADVNTVTPSPSQVPAPAPTTLSKSRAKEVVPQQQQPPQQQQQQQQQSSSVATTPVTKKLHPRDSADSRRLKESIVAKTAQRMSPVKTEVQKIEALRQADVNTVTTSPSQVTAPPPTTLSKLRAKSAKEVAPQQRQQQPPQPPQQQQQRQQQQSSSEATTPVTKKLHPRDSEESRRLKESIVAKTAQRNSPSGVVKTEVQRIEAREQAPHQQTQSGIAPSQPKLTPTSKRSSQTQRNPQAANPSQSSETLNTKSVQSGQQTSAVVPPSISASGAVKPTGSVRKTASVSRKSEQSPEIASGEKKAFPRDTPETRRIKEAAAAAAAAKRKREEDAVTKLAGAEKKQKL